MKIPTLSSAAQLFEAPTVEMVWNLGNFNTFINQTAAWNDSQVPGPGTAKGSWKETELLSSLLSFFFFFFPLLLVLRPSGA